MDTGGHICNTCSCMLRWEYTPPSPSSAAESESCNPASTEHTAPGLGSSPFPSEWPGSWDTALILDRSLGPLTVQKGRTHLIAITNNSSNNNNQPQGWAMAKERMGANGRLPVLRAGAAWEQTRPCAVGLEAKLKTSIPGPTLTKEMTE